MSAIVESPLEASWEIKTLGDVIEMIRNGVNAKQNKEGIGLPISRIETIAKAQVDYERVGYADLTETQKEKFRLSRGDILFSHINSAIHVGKTAILHDDRDLYHGINLLLLRCGDQVRPEFLNVFLTYIFACGYWRGVCKQSVNQASVNQTDLKKVPIPVPPLPEQERIVTILEEAFEGIATATAHAERNLHNARELFQSVLQSTFEQKGEDWVETTLGDATGGVSTGPFGSLLHKKDYIENGIPLVNPAHISDTGIEPDLRKTVSEETSKRLSSYAMAEGDIVIGRRGEMGRCAVVTSVENGWLCGTGSFFIKPSDKVVPNFLVSYLRSDGCRERLENIAGGAVMKNLSNSALSKFVIPIPSVAEQKTIVQKLDALDAETRRLEAVYQRKLDALAELKQSLLQRAFAGEL